MKPRVELKVDIALNEMLKRLPGGDNFYIANNGHIREKNHQQRSFQNSFHSRIPHGPDHGYLQPRIQPPALLQPTVPQPSFVTNQGRARYSVQEAGYFNSNQAQYFRQIFPPQPQPSMPRTMLQGPVYTLPNQDRDFRPTVSSHPLVPVPTISLSATGPWPNTTLPPPTGPWTSTTLPPPSGYEQPMPVLTPCTASPEIRANNPAPSPLTSSRMDQSTNLTVATSDPDTSQAYLAAVASQTDPDQQRAVTGQQLQQQNQDQDQQQQPAVVTSDISEL